MISSRVWMRSSRVVDEIYPSVDEIQPSCGWDLAECGWDLAYRGREPAELWMRSSRLWMGSSQVVDEIQPSCGWDLAECGWDVADCEWDLAKLWMSTIQYKVWIILIEKKTNFLLRKNFALNVSSPKEDENICTSKAVVCPECILGTVHTHSSHLAEERGKNCLWKCFLWEGSLLTYLEGQKYERLKFHCEKKAKKGLGHETVYKNE